MNFVFKLFFSISTLSLLVLPFSAYAGSLRNLPGVTELDELQAEDLVRNCNGKIYYSEDEQCLVVAAPKCKIMRVTFHGTHLGSATIISENSIDGVSILKGTVYPLLGKSFETKLINASQRHSLLKWGRQDLCAQLEEIKL